MTPHSLDYIIRAMVDLEIPFFPNTSDNTHCFQAGVKMILKYFKPESNFSWPKLDRLTAKKKGLWTWPIAAMIWFSKNGFEVKDIEVFDYEKFAKQGEKYLIEFYGPEVARVQVKHSFLPQETKLASKLSDSVVVENRLPEIRDIKSLLDDGFAVFANVNSQKLVKKPGYSGHFVVIKGYNKTKLIVHDPGLPGRPNLEVEEKLFTKAWAFPNSKAKNLTAVRPV